VALNCPSPAFLHDPYYCWSSHLVHAYIRNRDPKPGALELLVSWEKSVPGALELFASWKKSLQEMAEKIKVEKVAVGFDLGTTYSAVAFSRNGKAEVIANNEGKKTTPSVVAYIGKQKIVGAQALTQTESLPQNVVYDSKRMMGRNYDDKSLQEDHKNWPFVMIKSERGLPVIVCDNKNISPEEVGGTILAELKNFAEGFLETTIVDCVITCPAQFNTTQREATKNAAKIAGLNCLRLINEPTAASVAYGVTKEHQGKVLIYDLGGGTFDVSVLSIKDGVFEVEATGGDAHLGGKDLDIKMIDCIMNQFNGKKTANRIEINDPKFREQKKKLSTSVEESKIALTNQTTTNILIPNFVKIQGKYIDLKVPFSRAALEKQAKSLVEKTLCVTTELLKNNDIDAAQIEKVVLVGGFTKMPYVRDSLKKKFGEKVSYGINPDEAVALGAAMMAEVLMAGTTAGNIKGLPKLLLDVTPLALGIELADRTMSRIIQPNTPIPATMEEKYTTSSDNQTSVAIVVFQGNREFAKDNKKLGSFTLQGIPLLPKNKPDIVVKFHISQEGVLAVTALEKSSGATTELVISKDKVGALNDEEIERMRKEAKTFEEMDKKRKATLQERENLERTLTDLEEIGETNQAIANLLEQTSAWLLEDDFDRQVDDYKEKQQFVIARVKELQGKSVMETN